MLPCQLRTAGKSVAMRGSAVDIFVHNLALRGGGSLLGGWLYVVYAGSVLVAWSHLVLRLPETAGDSLAEANRLLRGDGALPLLRK